MTHIARRQTTNAKNLGEGDHRAVHKAETKIVVKPINFHRAGELIQ